ncbi:fimbrial biogenesis chaperone [Klebsiella oxytoca]|uniref:fimbrial biogenesis chaperone n=1 Tax=Klebsiella oxytoca TaxID=571 RepID=UPI002247DA0B|nr:fimbria/pilus periplasmic chaperone [Klebsiella oxytoca]MCW9547309.1 fimbria/pilus periplasmic chaperone [Klebsiella oxytoca]
MMFLNRQASLKTLLLSLAVLFSAHAAASVTINGTRVIYNSSDREISVKLTNNGKKPVLVQSWIDNGDENAAPDRIDVPFMLTPPINRVNGEKGQTLRISYTGSRLLPADRESVYWLNVMEIPAVNETEANRLQIALRTRIKLFYRPAALVDRDKASEAGEKIVWSRSNGALQARNDSPYYVSLASVTVSAQGKTHSVDGKMIPPMGQVSFSDSRLPDLTQGAVIRYEYINDWGAVRQKESRHGS